MVWSKIIEIGGKKMSTFELPKISGKELKALTKEENLFTPGHRLCQGCGAGLVGRYITHAQHLAAEDRQMMVSSATGCLEVASTIYPFTSWNMPFIHNAFENTAANGSGAIAALEAMYEDGLSTKKVDMVMIAGDGGTYDIGLQSLSGFLERDHDGLYVCYTNQAYMNTGIQRSSGTIKGAATTTSPGGTVLPGRQGNMKDLVAIVAAHDVPFATASVSNPRDFIAKIRGLLDWDGATFMLADSPCPLGWRHPANLTLELAQIAIDTCVFPIYHGFKDDWVLDGKTARIAKNPDLKKPIEDYLKPQRRFRHLYKEEFKYVIGEIQEWVDEKWERLVAKSSF